jgi:ssRNA-specific RNase YbeY (16S rRNA maturation enzyme)
MVVIVKHFQGCLQPSFLHSRHRHALSCMSGLYDGNRLRRGLQSMMQAASLKDAVTIGLYVASTRQLAALNWRRHQACDSLSFPHEPMPSSSSSLSNESSNTQHSPIGTKESIESREGDNKELIEDQMFLGDIVLCPKRISIGRSLGAQTCRLRRLLAHHLCHLLGHDHHDTREHREMRLLERRILHLTHAHRS